MFLSVCAPLQAQNSRVPRLKHYHGRGSHTFRQKLPESMGHPQGFLTSLRKVQAAVSETGTPPLVAGLTAGPFLQLPRV